MYFLSPAIIQSSPIFHLRSYPFVSAFSYIYDHLFPNDEEDCYSLTSRVFILDIKNNLFILVITGEEKRLDNDNNSNDIMILSQGRKIIQRQRIVAARQSGKVVGGSQQVTTISSSSAASLSSLASSPSLPLTYTVENQPGKHNLPPFTHRYFSAASGEKDEKSEAPEGESLKDTVRRMQQEKGKAGADNDQMNDFMRKASSFWSTASEEVSQTWGELLQSGERKSINKKIGHPEDTVEGDEEYTGPVAIMVIDESENMTAWERMQKRLTDAPVIQGKENGIQLFVVGIRKMQD